MWSMTSQPKVVLLTLLVCGNVTLFFRVTEPIQRGMRTSSITWAATDHFSCITSRVLEELFDPFTSIPQYL
jgi:hypothetical protein